MYQLIGLPKLLSAFGILTAVVALIYNGLTPVDSVSAGWRIASVSATISGLLLILVGQTAAFPALCSLPIIKDTIPPINGDWIGEFTSNFGTIAEAFKLKASLTDQHVTARFSFRVRLFHVSVSAVSLTPIPNYMRSDTTAFRIDRCSMTHREIIHYVYDAVVSDPKKTDVDRFHGAAKLTILGKGDSMTMEGAYWTDRNWQRGQNTAGTLKLRRPT